MRNKAQLFVIVAWYGTTSLVLASKSHPKVEYGCAGHAMRKLKTDS